MLLKKIIQNSDFKSLGQFISADFFSVVPMIDCISVVSKMFLGSRDELKFHEVCKKVENEIFALKIEIKTECDLEKILIDKQIAELVLKVYFKQILASSVWILDFRAESWRKNKSSFVWSPSQYFYYPSDLFREAVIGLYRGFYSSDFDRFKSSLEFLGLSAAEEKILIHFGANEQTGVRFSLAALQSSFAEIFKQVLVQKQKVHPEFALLGAMLLSLYDALECYGEVLDVRSCFEWAVENLKSAEKIKPAENS